ncbi:MAG: IS30 family transposase [Patescibacteria group bacterium]
MEVRMEVSKIPKFRKLAKEDRILIAQWRNQGFSLRQIARWLRRNVSTISREIDRNSFEGKVYEPLHAQYKADCKRRKAWKAKQSLKNPWLYSYVIDRLRNGWSPEQISGRLKLKFAHFPERKIGVETIYRFVYKPENKKLRLWEYLRRKQARRRVKGGRKSQRVRIPDRISLHLRPGAIDTRMEAGHWEGDSLEGRYHLSGLHTEYERSFSLIRMAKINRINALETIRAQLKIFGNLPEWLRKSTTLDNGKENVKHTLLKRILGMNTYFADPYAAYQRGGNENANLWIRYYFPKGTDFAKVSDEEIKDVEWELNNRPRKRLGFKTPMEALREYTKSLR